MALGQSAELLFRISGDPSGAVKAINTTEAELKGLDSAVKRLDVTAQTVGSAMQSIGAGMQSLGKAMTAALTAPLAALAALGVKSALASDEIRTKVTALVGDVETANKKIAELTALSERSVGVTRAAALESFTQLKGIGGIADDTIEKVITSLGKLNAAFKIDDLAGFQRNLNQIFAQGFERADIKEAIGRVPFFEQLLEQAFGTKDGDKLRKLKESGKLTMDSFLAGMSDAIDNDPRIANISENLSTQLSKGFEKLNVALAPLGDAILKLIIPALNAVIPYVQRASEWFASLSPAIQTAVLAAGAFVAALGPALVIIGGVVSAIGSLVAAGGALGIALLAVVGVIVQIGPVLAVVAAQWALLYEAWTRDVGGIRQATEDAFEAVSNIVTNVLTAIQNLWERHKDTVFKVVDSMWQLIRGAFNSGVEIIADIIRIATGIIKGDWESVWDAFVDLVEDAVATVLTILRRLGQMVAAALATLIPIAVEYGARFVVAMQTWALAAVVGVQNIILTLPDRLRTVIPALIKAGLDIGRAFIDAVRRAMSEGLSGALSGLPLAGAAGGGAAGAIGGFGGGGGSGVGTGGRGGGGRGGGASDLEARDRERLRAVQDRIDAEVKLEQAKVDRLLLLEEYALKKREIDEQEYLNRRQVIEGEFYRFKLSKLQEEYDAALGNAKERLRIANEIREMEERYQSQGIKYAIEQSELDDKRYEDAIKNADRILEYERQQTAEVMKRLEAEKKAREAEAEKFYNDPANKPMIDESIFNTSIFDDFKDSWEDFFNQVMTQAPTLAGAISGAGAIMQGAFQGMAQAIGSVIQQWVLYGETGPAVMRKILASALSTIAAEAAVQAIYAAAYGFLMLATGRFDAAANAFIAAAIFGSIAVGAALAGRAVAGDSFKRQTSRSTGGASGSTAGTRSTSGQGGAWSSQKEVTIDAGRHTPFTQRWTGELTLRLDSNGVLKVVEDDVKANGIMRNLIIRTAEG